MSGKGSLVDDDLLINVLSHCPNLNYLDLNGCVNITNKSILFISNHLLLINQLNF